MTKQEAVIKYITENYLEYNRLRHDVISDKLQLRMDMRSDRPTGCQKSDHCVVGTGITLSDSLSPTANIMSVPTVSDANGLSSCREAFFERERSVWREMTKQDINSIVCHAAQEYDTNITSREVITALQSDLIPNVHPLREYILSLRPYTPDQPDWIDFVAQQVRVRESATDRCEAPVDRHFVAVDGRSAAPVDGRSAAPEDRLTGCSVSRESTASITSELQCSASDIDRTRGAVDRAEPCRSAAPEDRPTGCSVSRESTASITSELQCSASETNYSEANYSEPRERSEADRLWRVCFKGRSAAPEDRPTGCSVSRESTASITSDLQCSASDIDRTRGAVDRAEPCRSAAPVDGRLAAPEDRPTGCSVSRESTASITSDLQCSASETNYSEANYSEPRERSKTDRLWRACFKKWFVAMVASWMCDEVVNHQVLVLIGRQGIYKTTWLEHLIPPHLRAYTCKLANSTDLNKDERMRIAEFGLISLDEIDSMNNRELNQLKSIITATDVNERAAYAYTKERRVRLASFCASGNRRDFLTDITGNRRWLPFEVESILNPFHTILPYEQLYAQAWALAQDPLFSYWFDLDEIEVLEQHNQHFRDESNEEQLLPILFDVPAEGKGEFMTTAQISERLVTYGNIKKPMALGRLGVLMGSMGYRSVTRGNRQARLRGWIVYQRDTEEIAANKKLLAKECVTV